MEETEATAADSAPGRSTQRSRKVPPFTTRCREFFDAQAADENVVVNVEEALFDVVAVGVDDPRNIGSIFRLLGCFGGRNLLHVHVSKKQPVELTGGTGGDVDMTGKLNSGRGEFWKQKEIALRIKQTAIDCFELFGGDVATEHVTSFVHGLEKPDRVPLVVIETATGAEPITSFIFPRHCRIVVGSEGNGVPIAVMKNLRAGFDHIVYVPMPGPHKSLNVSTATSIALYEYRRQHPK